MNFNLKETKRKENKKTYVYVLWWNPTSFFTSYDEFICRLILYFNILSLEIIRDKYSKWTRPPIYIMYTRDNSVIFVQYITFCVICYDIVFSSLFRMKVQEITEWIIAYRTVSVLGHFFPRYMLRLKGYVIVSLPSPTSAIATVITEGRPCSSQGQRCRVFVGDSYHCLDLRSRHVCVSLSK